jgi:hypothetical protein
MIINMHSVIIEPTNYSPHVVLNPAGNLSLKGRSLMVDAVAFYQPLIEWAYLLNVRSVNFIVEIDYFNTSSSKMFLEFLRVIEENCNIVEFNVIWNFETDDEDMLTKGQIYEERLHKARFLYKELEGV